MMFRFFDEKVAKMHLGKTYNTSLQTIFRINFIHIHRQKSFRNLYLVKTCQLRKRFRNGCNARLWSWCIWIDRWMCKCMIEWDYWTINYKLCMIYQEKKALICKGKLIAVKSIHVIVMNIPLGDLTHQTTPQIKMFYPKNRIIWRLTRQGRATKTPKHLDLVLVGDFDSDSAVDSWRWVKTYI